LVCKSNPPIGNGKRKTHEIENLNLKDHHKKGLKLFPKMEEKMYSEGKK
jgi:hypothetical protein